MTQTYAIGTETALTDREWIKAFLSTLDSKGDTTHATYEYLRDNRYTDDGHDEELSIYRDLCKELGTDF